MHTNNDGSECPNLFYINYEECKLSCTVPCFVFSFTFYINYEECKWFKVIWTK